MNRRFVVLQFVVDGDTECVAPRSMDGRPRVLPVHEEAYFLAAASSIACAVGDIQVVSDNVSSSWEFL